MKMITDTNMSNEEITAVVDGLLAASGEAVTVAEITQAYSYIGTPGKAGYQTVPSGLRFVLSGTLADSIRFRHHMDQTGLPLDLRIDDGGAAFNLYPLRHQMPFVAPEPVPAARRGF